MEIAKKIDFVGEALSDLLEIVAHEVNRGAPLKKVDRYLWRALEELANAARALRSEEVRT